MREPIKKFLLGVVAATLALSVSIPFSFGPQTAEANSVQTNSLGCNWSADTWFTSIGWASTTGDSACTQDAALEFHYYDGAWGTTYWQQSYTYWIQWGHAATSIWANHWIMVQGQWRQPVFTSQ